MSSENTIRYLSEKRNKLVRLEFTDKYFLDFTSDFPVQLINIQPLFGKYKVRKWEHDAWYESDCYGNCYIPFSPKATRYTIEFLDNSIMDSCLVIKGVLDSLHITDTAKFVTVTYFHAQGIIYNCKKHKAMVRF